MFLQTYYIDHIGHSSINFRVGTLGQTMETVGFNKSHIISHRTNPIQIGAAYWFLYSESAFHYLPLRRMVFDYNQYILFDPPNIVTESLSIMTTNMFRISFTNILKDQSITLNEVFSSSKDIFVPLIEMQTISPGTTVEFNIFILPTETGYFSSLIFFITSRGDIPYCISFFVQASSQDITPNAFYYFSPINSSLTLKIPPLVSNRKLSIIYDSSLFSPDRASGLNRYFRFDLTQSIRPGFFMSFIHAASPGVVRTFPLFVSVSLKQMQSYMPVITVDVVTDQQGSAECEIKLVNPTGINFIVTSVSFHKDAPSNIKVELQSPPVVCARFAHTVIGKVIVYGTKEGEIDTSIFISYESSNPALIQTIEVPIKASVIFGTLTPSDSHIDMLQNNPEPHQVRLFSTFSIPIAVLSATIDSRICNVIGFSPNLIHPNSVSQPILIHLSPNLTFSSDQLHLTVITNVSSLIIPIRCYNGKITISEHEVSSKEKTHLQFYVGNVLGGTTTSFEVFITNPNPSSFVIKSLSTTPGIELSHFWMKFTGKEIINSTVYPFTTSKLSLFVSFQNINQNKPRNDTIFLMGDDVLVSVSFSWFPVYGDLLINASIPERIVFGQNYNLSLSVSSSYKQSIKLRGVYPINPSTTVVSSYPFIRPGTDTYIGCASFNLDAHFISRSKLSRLLNLSKVYRNPNKWADKWRAGNPVKLDIVFQYKSNYFSRHTVYLPITYSVFQNVSYDFGLISTNTPYKGSITIMNTLVSDLEINIHMPVLYSESIKILSPQKNIIQGGNTFMIEFEVSHHLSQPLKISVPVTTNATQPFFLGITASVVQPRISLLSNTHEVINKLVFQNKNDMQYLTSMWTMKYFLHNIGPIPIGINLFSIDNQSIENYPFLSINMNCSSVPSGGKCPIDVSVDILQLPQWDCLFTITLESCGYAFLTECTIIVSKHTSDLIEKSRVFQIVFVIMLSIFYPLYNYFKYIQSIVMFRKRYNLKMEHIKKTIQIFSTSLRKDKATQHSDNLNSEFGGKWVRDPSMSLPIIHQICLNNI